MCFNLTSDVLQLQDTGRPYELGEGSVSADPFRIATYSNFNDFCSLLLPDVCTVQLKWVCVSVSVCVFVYIYAKFSRLLRAAAGRFVCQTCRVNVMQISKIFCVHIRFHMSVCMLAAHADRHASHTHARAQELV